VAFAVVEAVSVRVVSWVGLGNGCITRTECYNELSDGIGFLLGVLFYGVEYQSE